MIVSPEKILKGLHQVGVATIIGGVGQIFLTAGRLDVAAAMCAIGVVLLFLGSIEPETE